MGIEVGTAMLISGLLSGGAGIASGLLGKKKTVETDTSPKLAPELKGLQGDLLSKLQYNLQNQQDLTPIKGPAIDAINRRYRNVVPAIAASAAGRGYGASGILGKEIQGAHLARIGDQNQLEGEFAKMQLNQENFNMQQAQQLIASGRGSTTTQTQSGNPVGSGISSGLETLTTLMALRRMMQGMNGGGGGGYTWGGGGPDLPTSGGDGYTP